MGVHSCLIVYYETQVAQNIVSWSCTLVLFQRDLCQNSDTPAGIWPLCFSHVDTHTCTHIHTPPTHTSHACTYTHHMHAHYTHIHIHTHHTHIQSYTHTPHTPTHTTCTHVHRLIYLFSLVHSCVCISNKHSLPTTVLS